MPTLAVKKCVRVCFLKISSKEVLTKNEAKTVKALKQPKFRQKYQKFLVENPKTANEFLLSDAYRVIECYVTEDYGQSYGSLLESRRVDYSIISRRQMEQISTLQTASSILLTVELPELQAVPERGPMIFLDRVQDPGNVGTIIRIADWYGIRAVLASEGCADFFNPKTVQATMGSMVNVSLHRAAFADCPTMPTLGAVMDGSPLPKNIGQDWILIVGNESRGIHPSIIEQVDHKVTIAGSPTKVAESLNAAMATAILVDRLLASE